MLYFCQCLWLLDWTSLCICAEESSAGDINIIRRENQDLFKQLEEVKAAAEKNQKAFEESAQQEQNRLTAELDSAKRALAAAESKNSENAKVMAELEAQLSHRLEEVVVMDNQVLGTLKCSKSLF